MKRSTYFFLLWLVLLVGLLSRTLPLDSALFNKYLGDALYAVAFYLLLRIVWPNHTRGTSAGATFIFVLAVEFFQLSLWPQHWRASTNLALKVLSVVLGSAFSWWDILAYVVGIGAIYAYDSYVQRLGKSR